MEHLDKPSGEDYHQSYQPPSVRGEDGEITLPLELIKEILSKSVLDDFDLQSTALVNRSWNKSSLETVRNEYFQISQLVEFLVKNLNKNLYKKIISDINLVVSDKTVLNSISIIDIKSSLYYMREQIVSILKNVNVNDLNKLSELYKQDEKQSGNFNEIFYLAKIYRKLDRSNEIIDSTQRDNVISKIVLDLVRDRHFDRSIEIAKNRTNSHENFVEISKGLAKKLKAEEPEAIVKYVDKFPKEYRNLGLQLIAEYSLLKEEEDSDIEESDSDIEESDSDIEEYQKKFDLEVLNKALKIASQITDKEDQDWTFLSISNTLRMCGKFEEALTVIESMNSDEVAGKSINYMIDKHISSGKIYEALELVEKIKHSEQKSIAYEKFKSP